MKLYGYWRSSCSWRVRIALAYKNIPYTYEAVHLVRSGGEQHALAHQERNPMAQVPSLLLEDGTYINQSLAIISYLESITPTPNLLGTTPKEKAWIWELSEMINAGTQPLQNLSILQYVQEQFGGDKIEWGQHFISLGLDAFHKRIAQTNHLFCARDTISLADLCLIPQLYNARRFSCSMERWPKLLEIESRCAEVTAFLDAHPDIQPDAQ